MRLRILSTLQAIGHGRVVAEQTLVAWVRAWEEFQDFDKGPDVPADCAAPDDGCNACFGIGPDGGLAFVKAVEEEIRLWVVGDGVNFVPLEDDVI